MRNPIYVICLDPKMNLQPGERLYMTPVGLSKQPSNQLCLYLGLVISTQDEDGFFQIDWAAGNDARKYDEPTIPNIIHCDAPARKLHVSDDFRRGDVCGNGLCGGSVRDPSTA
jgi:hypothetical protein